MQIEHWLNNPALPVAEILQVYGYRVRHGHWSKLPEVRAYSVSAAWQAIATVHLLDGHPDPQKPNGSSSPDLDLLLNYQLCTYYFRDTPTSLQKPVHLGLFVAAARNARSIPKYWCLVDLVQIGLYFCLLSCEYTKTNSQRCTRQFRLCDIQFQDTHDTIPFNAPDSRFLNALVVNLEKFSPGRVNFHGEHPSTLRLPCGGMHPTFSAPAQP